MAGALVFVVACAEMTAVIAGVNQERVVQLPPLRQEIHKTAQIVVQTPAAAEIVRKVFAPVALCIQKIAGHIVIGETLGRAFRAHKTIHIVLMMGLKIGNKKEQRPRPIPLRQIIQRHIRQAIHAIACKIDRLARAVI